LPALIADDCMDYCWGIVFKNRSDLKGKVMALLPDLIIAGLNVKFIGMMMLVRI
jgi:hypothetical protein